MGQCVGGVCPPPGKSALSLGHRGPDSAPAPEKGGRLQLLGLDALSLPRPGPSVGVGLGVLPPRSGSVAHQVVQRAHLCSAAGQRGAVMSTPGERAGGAPAQRGRCAMWPLPPWTGRGTVDKGWGHRPRLLGLDALSLPRPGPSVGVGLGVLPPRSGSVAHQVVQRAHLCSAAGQRGAVMSTPGERAGGAPAQRGRCAMWPLPPWTGRGTVGRGWGHRARAPRT